MAVGDRVTGTRRDPDLPADELEICDYQLLPNGRLRCRTPNGDLGTIDERWGIEEHEDGSISVVAAKPGDHWSIRTPNWHGYLEYGIWREVE